MYDKVFKDFVLQSGLILGLVYGIIIFITYFLGVKVMVSWWVNLFNIGLAIGAPIYYGIKWKQFKGGYLDFKSSFMVIFLIFAIASLISTVFSYTLYTVIDPALPEALFNEAIQTSVSLMEKLGTPESQIDEMIAEMQSKKEAYGLGQSLAGYGYTLIYGAVIAAIGGAIIKKNPPVFDQE